MSLISRVAVFDLGSARSKMIVASRSEDGGVSLQRYKRETGSAGELAAGNVLTPRGMDSIVRSAKELVGIAKDHGCLHSVAVATEIFRRASNGPVVLSRLQRILGEVSLLSSRVEGEVFYSLMQLSLGESKDICVMDVGGGSVQVVWGEGPAECVSLPTGTFFLEQEFQDGGGAPSLDILRKMQAYVDVKVAEAIPQKVSRKSLVFGSNCMLDFVLAVGNALKVEFSEILDAGMLRVSLDDLLTMLTGVAGKPYDAVGAYFPDNPVFMRGADKALINVYAVANRIKAKYICPTNESVGTALARLALGAPHRLTQKGINIHELT